MAHLVTDLTHLFLYLPKVVENPRPPSQRLIEHNELIGVKTLDVG